MTNYYYLLKGLRRKNSKMIFTGEDIIQHTKGDKIYYKDKEYTVIYVDYNLVDFPLSNEKRFSSRQIYLRENK